MRKVMISGSQDQIRDLLWVGDQGKVTRLELRGGRIHARC